MVTAGDGAHRSFRPVQVSQSVSRSTQPLLSQRCPYRIFIRSSCPFILSMSAHQT